MASSSGHPEALLGAHAWVASGGHLISSIVAAAGRLGTAKKASVRRID